MKGSLQDLLFDLAPAPRVLQVGPSKTGSSCRSGGSITCREKAPRIGLLSCLSISLTSLGPGRLLTVDRGGLSSVLNP